MKLGDPLPSFAAAASWLAGPPAIDALAGKPLLVHFWSLGCHLCHDAAPTLARWRDAYSPRGLVAIAVCQPRRGERIDPAAAVDEASRGMHLDGFSALDGESRIASAFGSGFAPGYFIFDAAHRLRHRQMGNAGLELVESVIVAVLPAKASGPAGA